MRNWGSPGGKSNPHWYREVDWTPSWEYPDLWPTTSTEVSELVQGQEGARRSWPRAEEEGEESDSRRKAIGGDPHETVKEIGGPQV